MRAQLTRHSRIAQLASKEVEVRAKRAYLHSQAPDAVNNTLPNFLKKLSESTVVDGSNITVEPVEAAETAEASTWTKAINECAAKHELYLAAEAEARDAEEKRVATMAAWKLAVEKLEEATPTPDEAAAYKPGHLSPFYMQQRGESSYYNQHEGIPVPYAAPVEAKESFKGRDEARIRAGIEEQMRDSWGVHPEDLHFKTLAEDEGGSFRGTGWF